MGINFIIITFLLLLIKLYILSRFRIISFGSSNEKVEEEDEKELFGNVFDKEFAGIIRSDNINLKDNSINSSKVNITKDNNLRILQENTTSLNNTECNINTVIAKKLEYVNETIEDKYIDIPYAIAIPYKCNFINPLLSNYSIGYYKNPFAYIYKYGPNIISYVVSFKNINKNKMTTELITDRYGKKIDYDPPILLKIPFYNIPSEQRECTVYDYKRESRLWKKHDSAKIVKIVNSHPNVDKLNVFISIVNDGEFGVVCEST